MRCSTKYVGLDVHQATTLATVRQASGKIIARSVLPTEETAVLEFFASMRGAVHVAFEEGTQAQWLHDLLSPRVARVVVCNRRGTPRQGNKGDRVDSAVLSDLLRSGQLRSVYHGRTDRLVLKELTRSYENLVEDSVRAMLRMKALFRARAIRTPGTQVYEPQSRGSWLDRLPDRGCRFRAEALAAELDLMRRRGRLGCGRAHRLDHSTGDDTQCQKRIPSERTTIFPAPLALSRELRNSLTSSNPTPSSLSRRSPSALEKNVLSTDTLR